MAALSISKNIKNVKDLICKSYLCLIINAFTLDKYKKTREVSLQILIVRTRVEGERLYVKGESVRRTAGREDGSISHHPSAVIVSNLYTCCRQGGKICNVRPWVDATVMSGGTGRVIGISG